MAAPNYEQVQSFANVRSELLAAAKREFMRSIDKSMSDDEIMKVAAKVAAKFRLLGSELGAQWYDLCAKLAGLDVDKAEIQYTDEESVLEYANSAYMASYKPIQGAKTIDSFFADFLEYQIQQSINDTGTQNLWRDYFRGIRGGRWARVPVGETCAWCIMLASNGAWYLTEESALSKEAGHYHRGCNCIAVYYSDAEQISGYGATLGEYKDMYYSAENRRIANANGKEPYPDELAERIATAKADHNRREEERAQEAAKRGEDYKKIPWKNANEDMILMRELYGLK